MASFGGNLRRERELRGVSLREIADSTKISFRFLEALEHDRVEILPGGLFSRAFVRQYAEFLGLDAERVVSEFLLAHGQPQPEREPPAARRFSVSPGAVFFAAVAVVAVVLAFRRPEGESRGRSVVEPTPSPAAAVVLPGDRVYPPPAPRPPGAERGGAPQHRHHAAEPAFARGARALRHSRRSQRLGPSWRKRGSRIPSSGSSAGAASPPTFVSWLPRASCP